MSLFKNIYLAAVQLVRRVYLLPRAIERAVREDQQRRIFDKKEAERLDRIRNPLKYRGK